MFRRIFFLAIIFFTGGLVSLAKDSISVSVDSVKNSPVRQRAEAVLDAVFKKEAVLNNADSIIQSFDDMPSFGIYKNNYVVTGTTIGHNPDKDNSDAKFQISVMQRLTNSVLPFRTYLFLTYSQLAFWDIYKESFPFSDINFNPTVGIGKALVYKNRFLGTLNLQLEHESNGKAGDDSRSWNKVSFGSIFLLNNHWTFQTKLWIPIVDGQNNKNIVSYKGFGHFALDYNNKRLNVGALMTKRAGSFFDYNMSVNVSYKIFKNENQHLFVEYYNGYGENMLFFKQYRQRIRVGFVIMPGLMRIY